MSYCLNPECSKPQNLGNAPYCQACGTKLIVRERYRAVKLIGQGGFGRTFLAVDEDKPSKPYCVIKQFFPQAQGTTNVQKAAELFEQEAVRLDDLGKHPQVPELLAHFTHETRQYLVQEFINGQNLAEVMEVQGAFSESQVIKVLESLLPVLTFIHSRQVIHRDIKPANIIRAEDGRLVLVDFGAAKSATATALMRTGTSIGTPEFLAPEQARGRAVFASDLYGLGVTCIHLLTGVSPFELFDVHEDCWVWREFLGKNPVSDRTALLLDKLIENAISRRYRTTSEVLADLAAPSPTTIIPPVAAPARPLSVPVMPSRTPAILRVTSPQLWRCVQTLTGHTQWVRSVAISADSQWVASGGEDSSVKLWQVRTGEVVHTITGHCAFVTGVVFTPDGKLLLTASEDKQLKVWEVQTGKLLRTLADWGLGEYFGHSEAINAIALSRDGVSLASASNDKTIKLWRLGKDITHPSYGQVFHTLTGHNSKVRSIAISPDGQVLASGSEDGTIRLWQISQGREIGTLGGWGSGLINIVYAVAYSPDGEFLASGGWERNIKIWQVSSGEVVKTLIGHSDYVRTLAFSPRSRLLASASDDFTIKLWDLETGEALTTLAEHSNLVTAIAFSADGQTLVSASGDKTVKIWRCN